MTALSVPRPITSGIFDAATLPSDMDKGSVVASKSDGYMSCKLAILVVSGEVVVEVVDSG